MNRVYRPYFADIFHTIFPYLAFGSAAFVIGALAGFSPLWATLIAIGPLALLLILALPNGEIRERKWPFLLLASYLFVLTSWPHYAGVRIPGLFQLQPYRVLYFMLLIYGVYALRTSESIRHQLLAVFKENSVLCFAFVGFMVFQIIAAVFGKGPMFSLSMLFKDNIVPALLILVCVAIIKEERKIHFSLIMIVLSACFVSIVGIVESILEKNLFSSLIPATDEYAISATTERLRGGQYRAQGTFDSPLLLVDFLVTVFPIAIYFLRGKAVFLRFLGVVASVLIAVAIVRTRSRAGLGLAIAEVGIIYVLINLKKIRYRNTSAVQWFGLLMVIFGLILFIPFIGYLIDTIKGVNAEESGSTVWRLLMINGAINKFLNFDWFGTGIGYGSSAIGVVVPTRYGFAYVLDSYYLTVFADSGLLSLFAYIVWSLGLLLVGARNYLDKNSEFYELFLCITVSIFGFLGVKLISSQMPVFPLFYFLCACILLLNTWKSKSLQCVKY